MSGISKQIEKSRDLAQIETDEAETWHTLRLLVHLSVGQVSASYLSISSLKFHMNLAAQCAAAHRPGPLHPYP